MMPGGPRSLLQVDILVEDAAWRREGTELLRGMRKAIRQAYAQAGAVRAARHPSLAVLLTGDDELCALNWRFRGKRRPTNVLSFPAPGDDHLGDIAIAHGVVEREAAAGGIPLHAHALHLAVHGTLHLLGFDHETPREAKRMEPLETSILAKLGIADPYRRQASQSPGAKGAKLAS